MLKNYSSRVLSIACLLILTQCVLTSSISAEISEALGVSDPCSSNNCEKGTKCVPEPKQCIRAPCPQYKCVPSESGKKCLKWSHHMKCTQRIEADCTSMKYGCVKRPCLKAIKKQVCVRRRAICLKRRKVKYCAERSKEVKRKCEQKGETQQECVRYDVADPNKCKRFETVETPDCCSMRTVCTKSASDGKCLESKEEKQCTCTKNQQVCAELDDNTAQTCLEYKTVLKPTCRDVNPCIKVRTATKCVQRGSIKCTKYNNTSKCIRRGPCIEYGKRCRNKGKCLKRKRARTCVQYSNQPKSQEENMKQTKREAAFYKEKCTKALTLCESNDEDCRRDVTRGKKCSRYTITYKTYLRLKRQVAHETKLAEQNSSKERRIKRKEALRRKLTNALKKAKRRQKKFTKRCYQNYRECVEGEHSQCRRKVSSNNNCRVARTWRRRYSCVTTLFDCKFGSKSIRSFKCHQFKKTCSKKAIRRAQEERKQKRLKRARREQAMSAAKKAAWKKLTQLHSQVRDAKAKCKTLTLSSNVPGADITLGVLARQKCRIAKDNEFTLRCKRFQYHCKFIMSHKKTAKVCWKRYHKECATFTEKDKARRMKSKDLVEKITLRDELHSRAHRLQHDSIMYHDQCMDSMKQCDDDACRKFVTDSSSCRTFRTKYHNLKCTIHMYRCKFGKNGETRRVSCRLHDQQCTQAGRIDLQKKLYLSQIKRERDAVYDNVTSEANSWNVKCTSLIAACKDDACRDNALNSIECAVYNRYKHQSTCLHYQQKCTESASELVQKYYCDVLKQECEDVLKQQQAEEGPRPSILKSVTNSPPQEEVDALLNSNMDDIDAAPIQN